MHMQRDAKFTECRSAILPTVAVHAVVTIRKRSSLGSISRILLYKLLYIILDLIALSIPTWRKRRRMMLWH